MKFWDASAVVPLLIAEISTRRLLALAAEDPAMLVWWGSEVECALARAEREAAIDADGAVAAFSRLGQLKNAWHEIDQSDAVRETAVRLLRVELGAPGGLQAASYFHSPSKRRPATRV